MSNTISTIRETDIWKGGSLCEKTVVLDVRTPAEFREAHIPGSRNIPLADLAERTAELESGGERITIVCRTGRRATDEHATLCGQSDKELLVLEGGILSWMNAGLPVNRGKKAISLERQVPIAAGTLTLVGVLGGFLLHPAFFGLSGLVGAGLVFSGVTDSCAMGMMLAKMPWNRGPAASCDSAS